MIVPLVSANSHDFAVNGFALQNSENVNRMINNKRDN